MASIPLNTFKNITYEVTNTPDTVYTAPLGTTSIILMAQVANNGNRVETVTFRHWSFLNQRFTTFVLNSPIPPNDARVLNGGKLVIQTGDYVTIQGSNLGTSQLPGSSVLEFFASILETANQ